MKVVNFEIEARDEGTLSSGGKLVASLYSDFARANCTVKMDDIETTMKVEIDVPDEALQEIAVILERYIK